MIKFSIVIPSYNSEKWIENCLLSVLKQSYNNYEIILVDDVSTDATVSIAEQLLFPPHKIIKLKNKRLQGGTRNEGINNAIGDYIINIDADDALNDEDVLKDIADFIEDNNNPDVIYTGFNMVTYKCVYPCILKCNNDINLIKNPYAAAWLKVVKKELYLKYPFPEGTMYEDRIQNYEMICLGKPVYKQFERITHIWNRTNENATTFNPLWETYRFNYLGSLYRLIPKVENKMYKKALIDELKNYQYSINELLDGVLYDD